MHSQTLNSGIQMGNIQREKKKKRLSKMYCHDLPEQLQCSLAFILQISWTGLK